MGSDDDEEALVRVPLLPWQADFMNWPDQYGGIVGGLSCQPAESVVLMADGRFKKICDVVVGDLVISPQEDGSNLVATVTHTTIVRNQPLYRVTVSQKGGKRSASYTCSGGHRVPYYSTTRGLDNSNQLHTARAEELMERLTKRQEQSLKFAHAGAIDLPEKRLPLDPYTLGVFLGDGSLRSKGYRLMLNMHDTSIINRLSAKMKFAYEERGTSSKTRDILISIGVVSKEKHIPEEYKYASLHQRLELLAGLIDTGGTANEYSSASEQLANDFAHLVHSVGGRAKVRFRTTRCGQKRFPSWRVYYVFSNETRPILSVDHKNQPIWGHNPLLVPGKIEKLNTFADVYGIEVDSPSHWYVTDDWLITHNSGKTAIACNWFIDRCMRWPKGVHVIFGKDLPQLKTGTLKTMRGWLETRGIGYTENQTTGYLKLENGCSIQARGSKNFQGTRSLEADTILCDELAEYAEEKVYVDFIAPRLRPSPSGRVYTEDSRDGGNGTWYPMLRWTANPPMSEAHWFARLVKRGGAGRYMHVSVYDNYLMGEKELEAYIAERKRSMLPSLWPILLEGKFGCATTGRVYSVFDRERHVVKGLREEWEKRGRGIHGDICWSLDFNVGLMCSVWGVMERQKRIGAERDLWTGEMVGGRLEREDRAELLFRVLGEIRMPNAGVPDVVAEFIRLYKTNGWQGRRVRVYGDASGSARSQAMSSIGGAPTNWSIILHALRAENIEVVFCVGSKNPRILDRVNTVCEVLGINGNVSGLEFDADGCIEVCSDLASVDWKKDVDYMEIDKSNPLMSHLSDALGYWIWTEKTLIKKAF